MNKTIKNILWVFFILICAIYIMRVNETFFEYLHVGIPFYLIVSGFFIVLGVTQLFRKKPVGGGILEAAPRRECVTDMKEWNQKHGILWIGYGIAIIGGFAVLTLVKDDMIAAILHTVVTIGGLTVYAIYDDKLKKVYLCAENKDITD